MARIAYPLFFCAALLLGGAAPAGDAVPVLLVLEHAEAGKPVGVNVEAVAGVFLSPERGKPQDKWIVRPGHGIRSENRPGDRLVALYRGTGAAGAERVLLAIIHIRYFTDKTAAAWMPRFMLVEEPLVARTKDGWKPFTALRGAPSLIVLSGGVLPNAEGFYPALELGFSVDKMQIDSWAVQ